MLDRETVLKTYASTLEAEVDRGRLEAAGIAGRVASDDCGGMRPHLAYTLGVRLLVAEGDAERARELLASPPAEPDGLPWTCACGEGIEAGFDVCWNCGAVRD